MPTPRLRQPKPSKPASVLESLLRFDRQTLQQVSDRAQCLIGCDEVGRGSLMGPVVAAAVSLPYPLKAQQKKLLKGLNDSKKLNRPLRAELAAEIQAFCRVGVGEASREEIDTLNIHHASLLAMARAYEALVENMLFPELLPGLLLVDGRHPLPTLPAEAQQTVIGGDGRSACIAAASVVAKHTRDSYILQLAEQFPHYGWEANMGYGTPSHLQAISQHGPTCHHRTSFKLG